MTGLAALLGLDDQRLSWRDDALCAQVGGEEFFPEKGESNRHAKQLCASCDVRLDCLQFALDNDERFGVWGGLSEKERRRLRPRATGRPRQPRGADGWPRNTNHGTEAGYKAHGRLGEDACAACRTGATEARCRREEKAAARPASAPAPVEVEVPRDRPGVTRPWRPAELATAVALLVDYGMTAADIAAELHVSPARVRGALRSQRGAA